MKRLLVNSGLNSPQEYDRIYRERSQKGPDWYDLKRWKELTKYFSGGKLVDLGCLDSGIWDLIKDFGTYYGLDLAEGAIREMNEKHGGGNAKFIVGDLYDTGIKDDVFDYAVLGEVLEHLEDPGGAVKEAFRILRPGGVLAISTPLKEEREPGAVDLQRHIWSFTKRDILDFLESYSDTVEVSTIGSQFLPYRYAWPSIIAFGWKK